MESLPKRGVTCEYSRPLVASRRGRDLRPTLTFFFSFFSFYSVGQINNHMSSDLDSLIEARLFMLHLISAPLGIAVSVFGLYKILGWSSFVGISFLSELFRSPDGTVALQSKYISFRFSGSCCFELTSFPSTRRTYSPHFSSSRQTRYTSTRNSETRELIFFHLSSPSSS